MHCNGNWFDNIENHWKLPGVWGTFYTGTTQSRECGRHLWCFLVPILLDTAAYYCRLFDSSRMFSLCWFLAALATLYLPNSDHPDPDHHDHPDPDQKECSKLYVIARAVLHCFNIFLLIISPQEIIIASILPLVILCEDTFTILKDHHSLVWLFWVANRREWYEAHKLYNKHIFCAGRDSDKYVLVWHWPGSLLQSKANIFGRRVAVRADSKSELYLHSARWRHIAKFGLVELKLSFSDCLTRQMSAIFVFSTDQPIQDWVFMTWSSESSHK